MDVCVLPVVERMQLYLRLISKVPAIDNMRGLGAMIGLCFRDYKGVSASKWVSKIQKTCLENNLIVLQAGMHKQVLRFLPALTITDEELKHGLDTFEQSVLSVQKELG